MPVISIGMPVYNGENYIEQAIESIISQDYRDFELIISDNFSEDKTGSICKGYAKLDGRIKYISQDKNRGAAFNYNYVFRQASGKYFKWAAHDDIIKPEFLSSCLDAFERFGETHCLVYSASEFIDEAGNVVGLDEMRQFATSDYPALRTFQIIQGMQMVPAIFGLFRSEKLARTDLIGSYAASDYVLLAQCAMLGKVERINGDALFQRRIHARMSRKANTRKADVLNWFDPEIRSRLTMRQKLYLEYVRAPYRLKCANISWMGKLVIAAAAVTGVALRRSRVFAGALRQAILNRPKKFPKVQ